MDIDSDKPNEEEIARLFGYEDDYLSGRLSWWQKLKPQIWSVFDEPYSSLAANVSITPTLFLSTFAGVTYAVVISSYLEPVTIFDPVILRA